MEAEYIQQLIAHNRVLLEKQTVLQPVMKISDLYLVGANE
jgi:hypothetical protein